MSLNLCPACGDVRVRRHYPCPKCWRRMPAELRRRFAAADRARVQQPVRFQETSIEVLQWCRNHRWG